MEFRLLGPLDSEDAGAPVGLGGRRQRSVLAFLLLANDSTVSVESIVEAVWGGEPPPTAAHLVRVYISQLRQVLDGRAALATEAPGYRLTVEPDRLDSARFERLLDEARGTPDDERALGLYELALSLWRGDVLADLDLAGDAVPAVRRLEELRWRAIEERNDVALRLGRHGELVGELGRLAAAEPLRERLREQEMLALYRAGRQAGALSVYRETRQHLAEQLGIEPGTALRDLERRILEQDPALDLAPGRPRRAAAGWRRRRTVVLSGVLALAGVIGYLAAGSSGGSGANGGWKLAGVDAATGRVVNTVAGIAVPHRLTAGSKFLWVADDAGPALDEVDARSGLLVRSVPLSEPVHDLVETGGNVWLANGFNGTVTRVPANLTHPGRPFRPTASSTGRLWLAAGDGSLWIASQDGSLIALDPTSGRVRRTIRGLGTTNGLAFGFGSLWVAEGARAEVLRVAPDARRAIQRIPIGGIPSGVAAGAGFVWSTTPQQGQLWKIDPHNDEVVGSVQPTVDRPQAVTIAGGAVWVVSGGTPTVVAINPSSYRVVTTVQTRSPGASLGAGGQRLWIASEP